MKFLAWIKNWVRTAADASSRIAFYRRIGERKITEAIGHLAMLAALLWVLPFAVAFFIGMHRGLAVLTDDLRTQVPPGMSVELKNGKLTSNLASPLVLRGKEFTVVFNTATTTLDLAPGETGVVINADGLVQQQGTERDASSFKSAPDFKTTREDLQNGLARWAPLGLFLGSLLALSIVFVVFLSGFIINAALHGLVLLFALKLLKRPWPWRKAFVAAAYASTAPIVLRAVVSFAGQDALGLLPNVLAWAMLAWVAYDAYKQGGPHEPAQQPAVDRPDDGPGQTR